MKRAVWILFLSGGLAARQLLSQQPEAGSRPPLDTHGFQSLLDRLEGSELEVEAAKAELRRAGTNVLPLLMEQVRAFGQAEQRGSFPPVCGQALRLALEVFGPEAQPLLPELLAEFRARRALRVTAYALAQIGGPEASVALLEGLSDSNTTVRTRAAEAIGYLKPDASTAPMLVKALLTALADPSPAVRLETAIALGRLAVARERVIPALLRVAKEDPHLAVQVAAMKAIPNFGVLSRGTKAQLQEIASSHPEDLVRKVAQEILGEAMDGKKALTPRLVEAGRGGKESTGARDTEPAGALDAHSFAQLLHRLDSPFAAGTQRQEAAAQLRRAGTNVLPLLMQQVRAYAQMEPQSGEDPVGTSEQKLRLWAAFDVLGEQARPLLSELLAEFRARRGLGVTAYALARIGGPDAGAALLEALGDSNAVVRACAAAVFCDLKGDGDIATAAVERLLSLLRDESETARAMAARALGCLGKAPLDVVPALLRLAHEDWSLAVQIEAVRAVGKFAPLPASAKADLEHIAASHKEELVRRTARSVLQKTGGGEPGPPSGAGRP